MRQHGGDALAQTREQGIEHVKRLALVLVQRVALAVGSEPDALAQVIKRVQVFLPMLIEDLQHEALLDHAPDLGPDIGGTLGHAVVDGLGDARLNLFVGDALLPAPFGDRQIETEDAGNLHLQGLELPLLGIGLFRHEAGDQFIDHVAAHVLHRVSDIVGAHQLDALLVDHLALVVHHVVELKQVLADLEVARLDLLLRLLKRLVDPGMDDGFAVLEPELAQHAVHALGAEDAHQIVFQREKELGVAGIALAPRAAAELVIDAPALVPLGAEDVSAAGRDHALFSAATSALIASVRAVRSA